MKLMNLELKRLGLVSFLYHEQHHKSHLSRFSITSLNIKLGQITCQYHQFKYTRSQLQSFVNQF